MKKLIFMGCMLWLAAAFVACDDHGSGAENLKEKEWPIEVDHQLTVIYQEHGAAIRMPDDLAAVVSAGCEGADVSIELLGEISGRLGIRLSGTSQDGSFVYVGDQAPVLYFDDVNLSSQKGAAVEVKSKAVTEVYLGTATTNTLRDAEAGEQKACFVNKGAVVFWGEGRLTILGRGKQGYKGSGGVVVKSGSLEVKSTVKDGFNLDADFEQYGGTVEITTTGDGYWDDDDQKTKSPSCLNCEANVVLHDGVLSMLSTGEGGKGLNSEGSFTMKGGQLIVTTTGRRYIDPLYEDLRETPDDIPDDYSNSPKAVKAESGVMIEGGEIRIRTEEDGGEGLESKSDMVLSGGNYRIMAYDDCINAAGDITITAGDYYLHSIDNDGIDTNINLYICGGNIVTLGSHLHELGIDVNDRSPNKKMYITGGRVICMGAKSVQMPCPTACDGAQPTLIYSGNLPNEGWALCDVSGQAVVRYDAERDYRQEAGGTVPELSWMVTDPQLKIGATYTLKTLSGEIVASIDALSVPYSVMKAVK